VAPYIGRLSQRVLEEKRELTQEGKDFYNKKVCGKIRRKKHLDEKYSIQGGGKTGPIRIGKKESVVGTKVA